jgi:glycosyltransferase involved in cell wall biosynthesis
MAIDSNVVETDKAISLSSEHLNGTDIVRIHLPEGRFNQETFDNAYDPEIGRVVKRVLQEQKPDLFIIMNFYMLTLAPVEAAKELEIPVVHIATDFVPVCRRSTFIRWDDKPCQVGESVRSCAACFVSHRASGRAISSIMNRFPEDALNRWAENYGSHSFPSPFWVLKPYWKQVSIMDQRLKILGPLREQVDLVLTPTKFTHRIFRTNGFRPERVHHFPFGVEKGRPMGEVTSNDAPHVRLLFIGRFQPYKGAHLLVDAFNNLGAPRGATLTLYGAPHGYESYFQNLKSKIASNDRIHFNGILDPSELGRAFAETDYFVLPSTWHENSPLILLDALQSKTPVIASDVAGVTDLIKDGVNGLLFPMGDKQALQQVIQKTIDQPPLVDKLRKGIDLPDIDEYARNLIDLCQQLSLVG